MRRRTVRNRDLRLHRREVKQSGAPAIVVRQISKQTAVLAGVSEWLHDITYEMIRQKKRRDWSSVSKPLDEANRLLIQAGKRMRAAEAAARKII
jgi:hypothetical protein